MPKLSRVLVSLDSHIPLPSQPPSSGCALLVHLGGPCDQSTPERIAELPDGPEPATDLDGIKHSFDRSMNSIGQTSLRLAVPVSCFFLKSKLRTHKKKNSTKLPLTFSASFDNVQETVDIIGTSGVENTTKRSADNSHGSPFSVFLTDPRQSSNAV